MQPKFFIFLVTLITILSFVYADVVSVNSGGDTELVVNTNPVIEGFFSNLSLCGNSHKEIGEQCDDGNTISGDGCSSSCRTETSTATSSSSSGGGGAGGSGGSGSVSPTITLKNLVINPSELSVSVIRGVDKTVEAMFTNRGGYDLHITFEMTGDIKGVLTSQENIFSLAPGQSKNVLFNIRVADQGLLTGKIMVKYSGYIEEIPVVIASKSENFLFDISVYLGSSFKRIVEGNKISAQNNLIEVKLKEKVDVTTTYLIKDFEGNKYYENSETYFVLGEKTYIKEFPTETLPPGKYVLGYEVVYPGAFASSSDTFEVMDGKLKFNYKTVFAIAAILIFIFVIWIVKRKITESK